MKNPKTKKGEWEKMARHLFNPYAMELEFEDKDWRVFLNRLEELLDSQKEELIKEIEGMKKCEPGMMWVGPIHEILEWSKKDQAYDSALSDVIDKLKKK